MQTYQNVKVENICGTYDKGHLFLQNHLKSDEISLQTVEIYLKVLFIYKYFAKGFGTILMILQTILRRFSEIQL